MPSHRDPKRNAFADDIQRPTYHYLPPNNWMNDPNGVIQWQGRYHLFYQYNPNAAQHGTIHWGHAVSDNLITWEDLPIALAPTPNSMDAGGIFSGCMVDNDGQPTIFYTGVESVAILHQVQCMALGSDDLVTWQKSAQNPMIAGIPAEAGDTIHNRDPFVWRSDDGWYMVLGSQIVDQAPTALLYQSQDLLNWQYLHPVYQGDVARHGVIWECPNLFPLDDKWVLLVSCHTGQDTGWTHYFVGDFVDQRFTPIYDAVFDHAYLYAPLTFEDDQSRRLLWGWLREGRSVDADLKAGWSGVQSMPRELRLDHKNRLLSIPVEECKMLRGDSDRYQDLSLDGELIIHKRGLALDMEATITFPDSGDFAIRVASAKDDSAYAEIRYDIVTQQLTIARVYATPDPNYDTHLHTAHHPLDDGEALQLRILLDGSVLEVMANYRTSITSRVYPMDAAHHHVKVFGRAEIVDLAIYEMTSIW